MQRTVAEQGSPSTWAIPFRGAPRRGRRWRRTSRRRRPGRPSAATRTPGHNQRSQHSSINTVTHLTESRINSCSRKQRADLVDAPLVGRRLLPRGAGCAGGGGGRRRRRRRRRGGCRRHGRGRE